MYDEVDSRIINAVEDYAYDECDIIGLDMREYCYENGHYTYDYLECKYIITVRDLQEACDYLGLKFDVINY